MKVCPKVGVEAETPSEMHRALIRAQPFRALKSSAQRYLSHFNVIEHTVPCQHTRQYPAGVEVGHENDLRLAVKQYVPRYEDEPSSTTNTVTLVGAHANGFPKECYEPLWEDIYERLREKGTRIRSIWVADIAAQGQSGVLNETILGFDPSWWDHVRDLLFLINQKQADMPQPLIGVGHSVGASQLMALSLMHPRLLQAIVSIDPVIQAENPSMTFAPPSTYRRDLWPSRKEAEASFRKSKFYQRWDSRVLDKWLEFGLRELPTELHPNSETDERGEKQVTLTTSKPQEVFQYLRPLYKGNLADKDLYADVDPKIVNENAHFYRPEPRAIFRRLPEIYPPIRYIFGSNSEVSTAVLRRQKMDLTGSGIGGSGGVARGKVSETVLDCGHLVSMERTKECADSAADFIHEELGKWAAKRQRFEDRWNEKTRQERANIDEDWKKHMPPPTRPKKDSMDAKPASNSTARL